MVFVYDFHPAAETMMSRHFGSSPRNGGTAPFTNQSASVATTFRSAGLLAFLAYIVIYIIYLFLYLYYLYYLILLLVVGLLKVSDA